MYPGSALTQIVKKVFSIFGFFKSSPCLPIYRIAFLFLVLIIILYCLLRFSDIVGCFVKPLLFNMIILFQRIQYLKSSPCLPVYLTAFLIYVSIIFSWRRIISIASWKLLTLFADSLSLYSSTSSFFFNDLSSSCFMLLFSFLALLFDTIWTCKKP